MHEIDKEVKSERPIEDILRDLDIAAAIGLDMSPGDALCGEAAAIIRELIAVRQYLEYERGYLLKWVSK